MGSNKIIQAEQQLKNNGIDNGKQEIAWMLQEISRRKLPEDTLAQWIQRRINGEPFQYILGNTEFYNLTLSVGPGVLIPRPETELLVELSLAFLKKTFSGAEQLRICDLCTGSGAIALAIAKEMPSAQITGIDISSDALKWAIKNQKDNRLDNAVFFLGDLFAPLDSDRPKFQLITANPPYVTEKEYLSLDPVVKAYEPKLALTSGEDGLDLIRKIAASAPNYLQANGMLIMEIGCDQGDIASDILNKQSFHSVAVHKDYSGRDRIISAQI